MPPAVIGGVIAGVATIGGAALSSRSTSNATRQATEAQTQNTAANNALTREIYDRNTGNLSPFMQSGTRANALIDSFIYGPQSQPMSTAPAAYGPVPAAGYGGGFAGTNALLPSGDGSARFSLPQGMEADSWGLDSSYPMDTGHPQGGYDYPTAPAPGAVTTPANNMGGWDAFVASPYYQNPLAEGFRSLNHGLASGGRLNTGDAMKRAIRYGQDYGAGRQDEFLNLVGTQANRGFGAASALAGVGQNMVSNITANNNNAADAVSNAALIRAQSNNALINGVAGGIGTIAGGLFNRSSYGK